MILKPETWLGRGSWRVITDSTGVKFDCVVKIEEIETGLTIEVSVLTETDSELKFDAWIAPDETGLYTITLQGENTPLEGIGKLESLPHLVSLRSEDNDKSLVITLFELPEVYGTRGFYRVGTHEYTFELALKMRVKYGGEADKNAIIIPFDPRRRGN